MAQKKTEPKSVNAPPAKSSGPTQTSSLATVPLNTGLAPTSAPAWLSKHMANTGPRGLENVESDDVIYPRLLLCQDLTQAVKDRKADVGDILDSLSEEVLAKAGEELHIIPIVMTKSRMVLTPISEGGGIECRSDDSITAKPNGIGIDQGGVATRNCEDCVHKEWNDDPNAKANGRPKCTQFYNIVVMLPQHDYRIEVWSCKSTQVKVVRRFLSMAKQTGADFFALKFALSSVTQHNGELTFKNFDFKPIGYVTEEEYVRGAKTYDALKGEKWSVSVKDLEEPAQDAAPEPGSDLDEAQVNPTGPAAPRVVDGQTVPGSDAPW